MTATLIIGAYVVLILLIAVLGARARHGRSTDDYFLAGRTQRWVVSSLTMMATFFSAAAMMGVPGMVYRDGLPFIFFALNIPISASLIWIFGRRVHELGRRHQLTTPSDLVCHFHPSRTLNLCVAFLGFLYVLPYIVLQVKAGGYLFEVVSDGRVGMREGAVLLAVLTMVYVHVGGMRSVAWSDMLQGLLLLTGMVWCGVVTVRAVAGEGAFWPRVAEVGDDFLTVPGMTGFFTVPMIMTFTLVGSFGTMVSPGQWLRYNAARSPADLRRAAMIFAVCLACAYLFGMILVGLGGRVLFPDMEQPDQVSIRVMKTLMPAWAATLFMVSIMAAAMSTADSNLHALGAIVSRDIFRGVFRPAAGERQMLLAGHLAIFITMLIALGIVVFVENLSTLIRISMVSMAFCLQLVPVVADILWFRRATTRGAIVGILAGFVVVVYLAFLAGAKLVSPWSIHYGAWGFAANVVAMAGVSMVERRLSPASAIASAGNPPHAN